jgi:16S rRNA (guanine527-N7)-methyltransferase
MEAGARDARADASMLGILLEKQGVRLDLRQLGLLERFHALLVERNKTHNLTRIWGLEDIVLKHYVDSLLVLRFVPSLPSPLLDLGSGAGFPGVLLKIASPATEVVLAEAQQKKAGFLREVRDALALPGLEVLGVSVDRNLHLPLGGVISRAVEGIRDTLRRVRPLLPPGGLVIFMKGPSVDEEKGVAARAVGAAFREVADHAYTLPGTDMGRRLVVYERGQ